MTGERPQERVSRDMCNERGIQDVFTTLKMPKLKGGVYRRLRHIQDAAAVAIFEVPRLVPDTQLPVRNAL